MSDETAKVIEELIELEKKATPGPWRVEVSDGRKNSGIDADYLKVHDEDGVSICMVWDRGKKQNRNFIARLRNAAPTLLSLARRAVEAEKSMEGMSIVSTASLNETAAELENLRQTHRMFENWVDTMTAFVRENKDASKYKPTDTAISDTLLTTISKLKASESRVRELEAERDNWLTHADRLQDYVRELEKALKDIEDGKVPLDKVREFARSTVSPPHPADCFCVSCLGHPDSNSSGAD